MNFSNRKIDIDDLLYQKQFNEHLFHFYQKSHRPLTFLLGKSSTNNFSIGNSSTMNTSTQKVTNYYIFYQKSHQSQTFLFEMSISMSSTIKAFIGNSSTMNSFINKVINDKKFKQIHQSQTFLKFSIRKVIDYDFFYQQI